MTRTTALVALAMMLAGCATTPAYTNPAKGNDPQALTGALDRCEKAAQVACSPPGDSYRLCTEGKVKACMQAEGWTAK